MRTLAKKNAIITGASSGIGAGIAHAFAKQGARLLITYNRSLKAAETVVDSIRKGGGIASAVQLDLSQAQSIQQLRLQAQEEMGQVDILVNNAGFDILTGSAAALPVEQKLSGLLDVDLLGTINSCWAILPVMQQQGSGSIINMSWDLALHGLAGINAQLFATVKAGILGFSRALAKECSPVRVNVLSPGWIKTAFAEHKMDKDYYQRQLKKIPLGRFGTPQDVAAVAVFLASDAASYITGESIDINGGLNK